MALDKSAMITEILQVYKVSSIVSDKAHSDGDVFLKLCFCDESQLKKVCQELNIKT